MDYNFFDQVSVTGHLGWFQPFTVIKNGYDKHLCTRVYRSKFLEEKLLTQRYDIYLNKPQVGWNVKDLLGAQDPKAKSPQQWGG